MCKLPCSEGEAYGRWVPGAPPVKYRSKQPGPTAHAGGFFSSGEFPESALTTPVLEVVDAKRALRAAVLAARGRLDPSARAQASTAVVARLEALDLVRGARTLAVYAPLGSEVDVLELARRLAGRGVRVLFPRVVRGERRMRLAACAPEDLVPGPLGALEPPAAAPSVEAGEVDCALVPGLAFSLDGHRLGRGGGHYDATLASLPRAARIGVAFEAQVVPAIPREPHDVTLDALVTEARALRFVRESG